MKAKLKSFNESIVKNTFAWYVIEFLLSVCSCSIIMRIIYNANYSEPSQGVIKEVVSVILLVVYVICILYFITLIVRKCKDKIEKIFVAICIPLAVAYMVFVIPGYVADEDAHYFRAYEISTGKFIADTDEENIPRSDIPEGLAYIRRTYISNYYQVLDELTDEVDYEETENVFNATQGYFPVLYVISTLAFLIGRMFSLSFMFIIFIARAFNLIVFLICGYYIIKLLPFGKFTAFLYLLTPMILHQAASVSVDSFVNSMCLLYIAYIIQLVFREKSVTKIDRIICVVSAVFLGLAKTVYCPLSLLILLLVFKKKNGEDKKEKKKNLIMACLCIILCIIVAFSWYLFTTQFKDGRIRVYANDETKCYTLQDIAKDPLNFLVTVGETTATMGLSYLEDFIGKSLGWLDIQVHEGIILIYLILLCVSPFLEKHKVELSKKHKTVLIFTFLAIYMLMMVAMYIGWTLQEVRIIDGIQGRYFIPIIILLLLCICYKDKYLHFKHLYLVTTCFIAVVHFVALKTVIEFFI